MAVVATGFFDGVHIGHRRVLSRLVQDASCRGEESLVVTFWPHPRTVLQDDARSLRLLNSLEEKKLLLREAGVDRVEVLDFSVEFSHLTTEQYLLLLKKRFGATKVLFGYDNRIGSDLLPAPSAAALARSFGLEAEVLDPVTVTDPSQDSVAVSSTKIRTALSEGRVEDAAAMLGYRYMLHGVVVSGNHLGRTLGFPTANMQLYEPLKQLPGCGVYAVEVSVQGRSFSGMTNIGTRPTVSGRTLSEARPVPAGNLTIETNIFDFDEDIYGLDIRVRFIRKIRDERRFPSIEDLRAQLAADRQACR